MRKTILSFFQSLLFLFLLSGCGKNIPSADDKDVTKLVLEICQEEMQQQFFEKFATGRGYYRLDDPLYKNNVNSTNEDVQEIIRQVDETIQNINMKLRGIRTIEINKDVGKIRCATELTFANGRKVDIEYTAQYTENGELYVEVFGLK